MLCKCFSFLCFGLGFLCCYKWANFWITKSLINYFCGTIRPKLFNTEFFWFYVVCVLCTGIWVSSKCCVVCFGLYITSWFLQEFCSGCKYWSFADMGLLHLMTLMFLSFFLCTWTPLRVEPKLGQVPEFGSCKKNNKKFQKTQKRKTLGLVTKGPPFVVFQFYFFIYPPLGFGCGVPFRVFLCYVLWVWWQWWL